MSRLDALHEALAAVPWIPGCTCEDCTRQEQAGRLLDRLDTLLALLEEMSQDAGMSLWYSTRDLRALLRVLDAEDAAAGEEHS